MKRFLYVFYPYLACVAFWLMTDGCSRVQYVPVPSKDSLRTEVRTVVEHVTDTAWMEVPAQSAERTTRDTTSFLETDFAESYACIMPDGSLFHSLNNKEQEKPYPYDKEVKRNDSIVYKDRKIRVPYPVEKELSWLEHTSIKALPILLGLVAILSFIVVWLAKKMKRK